ncbi:MAG TPA: hypothetical protein GXZ82_15495 [Firmicutes bacterium]|jgi:hypothetical protein|nr:hypothetical protein [Bacillota bacterium]
MRVLRIFKWFFLVFGVLSFIVIIGGVGLTMVLSRVSLGEYEEIGRVPSPDGAYEAVLVEWDPGAIGSTQSYLYLVPTGTPFEAEKGEFKHEVFCGYEVSMQNIIWTGPRDLMIRYANDVIRLYENYWFDIQVGEFQLEPTVDIFLQVY